MIAESQWINLPVGENLMDHPNVRLWSISNETKLTDAD